MCEVCCTVVWTVGSSPAWESDSGPGFEVCWSTGSGGVRELAADKEEFGSVDSQDYELFISSCSSDRGHNRSEPTWFWWFWLVRTHLQAEPPRCLLPPPSSSSDALRSHSSQSRFSLFPLITKQFAPLSHRTLNGTRRLKPTCCLSSPPGGAADMDRCAFGSGFLRIALLWVVQFGAFAQNGKWIINFYTAQHPAVGVQNTKPPHD